jgi:ligand-binding sensor domain-containing protein
MQARTARGLGLPLLVGLLAAAPAWSEELRPLSQLVHDRWTQRDGLPHNVVEAVLVDRTGYLWLGTQEGLVRFDGARFQVFERAANPGLAGDEIYALLEDPAGDLWIGTATGLSRKRGDTFEAIATGGAPAESVHALALADGDLWVGTAAGLRRLHAGRWSVVDSRDGLPDERVGAIAPARRGGLWIGGRRGLSRWKEGRVERVEGGGLPSEVVLAVLEDRDGALWAGTGRGLARRPPGVDRFAPLAAVGEQEVRHLASDGRGALWLSQAAGLRRVAGERVEVLADAPMVVNGLFAEADGTLWFGTDTAGLHRLRPGALTTIAQEDGLSSRVAWAVASDVDGSILVAGDGGLDRIASGRVTPVRADVTRREGLTSVLVDRAGRIWLGTESRGAVRIGSGPDRRFGPAEGLRGQPRVIYQDAAGTIWFGARDGLYRLAGERIELVADTLGPVNVLEEVPGDALWVGTTTGLARLEGARLVPIPLPGLDGPADVTALRADPDGAVWVGSAGAGLWLLRGAASHAFTRRQGLHENQVFAIVDDGLGHLWLSGNHGLSRVARAELEAVALGRAAAVSPLTLGRADGMREIECSGGVQPAGLRAPDGRLWFPTILGVVVVAPATVRVDPAPPKALVEEVWVDGQPRSPAGALQLPPETRHLELRYTAPALASADRIRIHHRLLGLDDRFVDGGPQRLVHYAGLPPGRYEFQVVAASESGRWGDPATLAFEIEPRLWQRRWFRAAAALLAAAAVVGAFHLATRRLRRQRRELAAQAREQAARVQALAGLLPICSWCKRIKDEEGAWQQLERYIAAQERAEITHVMCPECYARFGREEP